MRSRHLFVCLYQLLPLISSAGVLPLIISGDSPKDGATAMEEVIALRKRGGLSKATAKERGSWLFGGGQSSKTLGTYDMVVNITHLEDIIRHARGWPLIFRDENVVDKLLELGTVKVGIIGNYNRGKTFVMNKLSGKQVQIGHLLHTDGLSAVLQKQMAFFDTAGENQPLDLHVVSSMKREESINQRLLGALFVQDLVQDLSDVLVVVVNQLTLEDQRYIRKLEEKMSSRFNMKHKFMLIVHNLKDIQEPADVDVLIAKDVVRGFGAVEVNVSGRRAWKNDAGVVHTVFAREGSVAGTKWNEQSLHFIKDYLEQKITLPDNSLRVSILERIFNFTMDNLPTYFTNLKKSDFLAVDSEQNKKKLVVLDGPRLNILGAKNTAQPELKKDAKIIEWEILYQNVEAFKFDYEVLSNENETVVLVDMPGVFMGSPANRTKVKYRENKINPNRHFFRWTEEDRMALNLTVRLVTEHGKGPGVEIRASRPDMADGESKFQRFFETAANRGHVSLDVDLAKILGGGLETFYTSEAIVKDNGMLSISLKHILQRSLEDPFSEEL